MSGRGAVALESARARYAPGVFCAELERGDLCVAAGAGLLALTVYVLTAAPTVTAEDAGELAAAAWTLGIAHPPGYPLFTLFGKAFATVVPVGDVAYRLNLFSALCGGIAVALAALLALRLGASRLAAAAAALTAALTPTLWSQATVTEVYALAAAVLLAVLHLTLSFILKPSTGRLWALAYVAGLALVAHPSLVFVLPGVAFAVLLRLGSLGGRIGGVLGACGAFLLGLSLYLYLPLRSLADPVMDWGDPETLGGFLAHVLRAQYRGLTPPPERPLLDPALYLGHVALFEVGAATVLLSVLGLTGLWRFPGEGNWMAERRRARRAFRAAYSAWLAFLSLGFLFVLRVSFEPQALALNSVYFIPLALILVPPAAVGLTRVLVGLAARLGARGRRLDWAVAAALPGTLLLWNFSDQDRSSVTVARDYAENILRTLPDDAVYIPSGDHASFPVLYLQVVEGLRPDVVTADKYGYLDPRMLRGVAAGEEEYRRVRRLSRQEIVRWLIDRSGRPVFVNSKHDIAELPAERFLPVGLLYRVDRERKAPPREEVEALWTSYRFANLDNQYRWQSGAADMSARAIQSEVLFHRAEDLLGEGRKDEALGLLVTLAEAASGYKEILNNAGSMLFERGELAAARGFYERALAAAPRYAISRRNYARLLLEQAAKEGQDVELAVAEARRSLGELPPDASLLAALGDALAKGRRWREARDAYGEAGALGDDAGDAWRKAGEVAERALRDEKLAKLYYARSLEARPTQPELIEKLHGKAARERYERAAEEAVESMVRQHSPLGSLPGYASAGSLRE